MKFFCFLPSAHIIIIRTISGDKENSKRKLLSELLALMFTRHCVCHMTLRPQNFIFMWGEHLFLGEKEQTPLGSQLIRVLSLFAWSDLGMTGEQALQEPHAHGLHNTSLPHLCFFKYTSSSFRLGPVIHREHLALHKEALNPLPSKHTGSKEGQVLLRDFWPDLLIRSLIFSVKCSTLFLHIQLWRKGLD